MDDDDIDDSEDMGGPRAVRPSGRADQLRIVGAEEAGARATGARPARREHTPGAGAAEPEDDLGSLRNPRRRSAFDSIPDAPPSFLDDLVPGENASVVSPVSADRARRRRARPAAASASAPDGRPRAAGYDGGGEGGDDDGTYDDGAFGDDTSDGSAADPTAPVPRPVGPRAGRARPAGPRAAGGRLGRGGRDLGDDEPAADDADGDDLAAAHFADADLVEDDLTDDDLTDDDLVDDDLVDDDPVGDQRGARRSRPGAQPAGDPWPDDERPAGRSPGGPGAPGEVDPNRFGAVPVIRVGPPETDPEEGIDLPHWTEPPTGQVPRVLVDEDRPQDDSWSTYGSAPRWRDPSTELGAADYSDVSDLADDAPRQGALDEGERPSLDDFFSFEDIESRRGRGDPSTESPIPPIRGRGGPEGRGGPPSGEHPVGTLDAGRDVPIAVGAGIGIAALFVVLLRVGPAATLALVTVAVGVAAAELMATTRRAGHHPAALVGLAAAAGLPLAVYWRGESAYPLVLFLAVAFSLFWFLFGVDTERPAQNVGLTLLAVGYVGLFGSFAALILRIPSPLGTNMLLAAAIPTVAADIGAFVVGRNAGRSPLTPISPSKTVEGALGGFAAAVTASVILNHFVLDLRPFDGLWDAAMLGVVVGIVSLLGDLCESLLKRSLGVKDMGTIIPGHGGVLDRFDALLFVLPATYYLAGLLDLIPT